MILMLLLLWTLATTTYAQEAITMGTAVTGELDGSIATYSFDVVKGDLFSVSAESDDFDTLVEVFNSDGNRIGSDDDGGENTNSLLSFVAQEDATYTFTVGSFFSDVSGAYTVTVTQSTPMQAEYDATVTLKTDGETRLYTAFDGTAGDVLNIWATSANEQDTKMTLMSPDGEEVGTDDESGVGSNPYLRRVELPSDGVYLILLESWFDETLTGTIDLTIETTENLPLTADTISVELGDEFAKEIFTLAVEAGTLYRITTVSENPENSINVDVVDVDGWSLHSLSANGVSTAVMEFTAETTGTLKVELSGFFFFDETGVYEINAETVE